MALTEHDKKNLSKSDQKKIQDATNEWNAANAKGDKAGMKAAQEKAAAIRNAAGYTTNSDGTYKSSNKNSQYTGSSNAVTVKNSLQQIYKDEMNANSIAWHTADEKEKARLEKRNQELADRLGGTVRFDPETSTWGGIAGGITEEDIVNWDYDEKKPKYQSEYDPRIDALLDEILNRDSFSYDAMNDPLYQQYAEMYRREGDRAMKNTLAEAAAGAGGMNTYAMTAAQQANNYYNSQLNDKIPELYQLAYQMYLNDIDLKVQDLGLLQQMDNTQYARYRDTMGDWYKDKNFAYGVYRDGVQQGNWQTEFDYNSFVDDRNFTNQNYWANKEFDYNDYWKNKEWDEQIADKQYDREQDAITQAQNSGPDYKAMQWEVDMEDRAYDKVMNMVAMGIKPSAQLLNEAGITYEQLFAAQASYGYGPLANTSVPSAISAPTSNGSGETPPPKKQNPTLTPTDNDKDGNEPVKDVTDASILNLGLGPINTETVVNLADAGFVKVNNSGTVEWTSDDAKSMAQKALGLVWSH